MISQQQILKDLVWRGYSLNEIAKYCGGYPEKLSEVMRGFKFKDGTLKKVNSEWTDKLKKMNKETEGMEENEHRFGKRQDWYTIITAIHKKGFTLQHIGDICGCQHTHIRDIISNYKTNNGKSINAKRSIQDRLYQLFIETKDWPDKKVVKGCRDNKYFTMVNTVGCGWQC